MVHIKAEKDLSGFIKFYFEDQQTWLSEVPLLGNSDMVGVDLGNSDMVGDDVIVQKKPASKTNKTNVPFRGYHQHVAAYQRERKAQGVAPPNPEVQQQKGKEGGHLALQEAGLL